MTRPAEDNWQCEWCHCRAYGDVPDNPEAVRCINCKRLNVRPGFELLFALDLAANRLAAAAVNAVSDTRLSSEYSEWAREAREAIRSARAKSPPNPAPSPPEG